MSVFPSGWAGSDDLLMMREWTDFSARLPTRDTRGWRVQSRGSSCVRACSNYLRHENILSEQNHAHRDAQGCVNSRAATIDHAVDARIEAGCKAFGALRSCIFMSSSITTEAKRAV